MIHEPTCAKHDDAQFVCDCTPYEESSEDRMIRLASIPDPATLLRDAHARGWVKPTQLYP